MSPLPFVLALICAVILAPALLHALREGGRVRSNYRERSLPCPFGILILAAALLALVPLVALQRLASVHVLPRPLLAVSVYALGVLALGLVDDTLLTRPRGWRGHGAAALRGELTTGVLKAVGSLGLAMLTTSAVSLDIGSSVGDWLLATGVLVLATNAFNLLDLRPGRALKGFVLLGVGLLLGAGELRPLWIIGLFAGPALVAGVYDLREHAMLGDTGANLLGALAGLWMLLTLSEIGQLVALGLLIAFTVYCELRSLSALIERTPLLRRLDSLGRPS